MTLRRLLRSLRPTAEIIGDYIPCGTGKARQLPIDAVADRGDHHHGPVQVPKPMRGA